MRVRLASEESIRIRGTEPVLCVAGERCPPATQEAAAVRVDTDIASACEATGAVGLRVERYAPCAPATGQARSARCPTEIDIAMSALSLDPRENVEP